MNQKNISKSIHSTDHPTSSDKRKACPSAKEKNRSHFLGNGSKIVLLYPMVILLVVLAILFFQHARAKNQKEILLARRQEAQEMMEVGFFSEAIHKLEENPEPKSPEDERLLFHAYLGQEDYRMAERMWESLDPAQQKETMESLLIGLSEEGKVAKAWKLLVSHQDLLSEEEQTDMGFALLSYVQEIPVQTAFVAGWFPHHLAVLKDADGYFLVNADGDAAFSEHYDKITPIEQGFLAMKQDREILLDSDGHFLSLNTSNIDRSIKKPLPSFEVQIDGEPGAANFMWRDLLISKVNYDATSPVSKHGISYVEFEGKNYRVRFDALRDGIAFNKIE